MPLWTRIIALVAALALSAAAAGCGGDDESSIEVPAGAIAVVGDREIPKEEYDRLLAQAQKTYEAREQDFPEAGTPEFAQLRNAIVRSLVERTEFEIAAEELGIEVTDEEVNERLDELKEQFFEGDEQRYKDELEAQGLTEEQVLDDVRSRVLSEKIFEEVTKEIEVADADVEQYYEDNKASFETPASREVRHILVEKKALADRIHAQLEDGGDFAKLAKQHSKDPASAEDGGKFTAQQGATVPPFDEKTFELETGELSEPVKTQFGWHIIEATGDIEPKATQPLEDVEEQIRDQLSEEQRNTAINEWIEELRARFAEQIAYAPGFAPPEPETTTGAGDSGSGDTTPAPTETD